MKKLSFCITCKNRFHQISRTLPVNLQDNQAQSDEIEFVLVDFESNDGLQEWVAANFAKELASGYLKYFFTDALPAWHASTAKNTAHYFATGTILTNLDCDNYTGVNGGLFVLRQFETFGDNLLLHQYSGDIMDGSFGRISTRREHFHHVGGYDQRFFPMSYQDIDLMERLKAYGVVYQQVSDRAYCRAICNTKEESLRYTDSPLTFLEMNTANKEMSLNNLKNNRLVANEGAMGIRHPVYTLDNNNLVPVLQVPATA